MELHISVKLSAISPEKADKDFNEFRTKGSTRSGDILIETLKQELVNRNLVVEGDLKNSWHLELQEVGDTKKILAVSTDVAASVLEYGANPAAKEIVNVREILNWATKKGIAPQYGTLNQFAWAVAKKIGKEGQPLHGGLKRPFNAAQKKANRKIEKIYQEEIEFLVGRLNT